LNRRLGGHQTQSGNFGEEKSYVSPDEDITIIHPFSGLWPDQCLNIFFKPLVRQRGFTGIPKMNGRYTKFDIMSFGHIFGCEFGYPVAFITVTIYLYWIAKDTGIMIDWFISIQNNEMKCLACNNIRYNNFSNVHQIKLSHSYCTHYSYTVCALYHSMPFSLVNISSTLDEKGCFVTRKNKIFSKVETSNWGL